MSLSSNINSSLEVVPELKNASFQSLDIQQEPEHPTGYSYARIAGSSATLRVKDLPASERPRDRLLASGGAYMSNSDLLSVLLGSGQGDQSAIDLSHTLLASLEDNGQRAIAALRHITPERLMNVYGIGEAKAATILAAIELGKRVYAPSPMVSTVIDDPGLAAEALTADLMWSPVEKFAIIMLDIKHQMIGKKIVSIGTASETYAEPKEIFKALIEVNASRGIVAHNHPSGLIQPSPEDINLTEHLLQAANIMNIQIIDHLILGGGNYTSLHQTTNLWNRYPQGD
ncbi:MAG: DNA repair protein RadC [Drouetiella hepatica Uher 2000/2452]|jgi:DNA repair protein RadC|uniref:DNA repair protein RadC n=1 Tax=Drouetiella hepatica Uher 2000/2452 TaxID=904376 RepID=A0A951UPY2_9CYAN|nr:DNA repair protein RadC [Drouetiella hepatica Uher 2000/2452]